MIFINKKIVYVSAVFMLLGASIFSCNSDRIVPGPTGVLQLATVKAGTINLNLTAASPTIPIDQPFVGDLSAPLDTASASKGITLTKEGSEVPIKISFLNDDKTFSARPIQSLSNHQKYLLAISKTVKGKGGETFGGIVIEFTTVPGELKILSIKINGIDVTNTNPITDVLRTVSIQINFSNPLKIETVNPSNISLNGKNPGGLSFLLADLNKSLTITSGNTLDHVSKYSITLNSLIESSTGEIFKGFSKDFYTVIDLTPKFPLLSDDALLTLVQRQTLNYFYDFAHPSSGMARERNTSGNTVTSGGSGFGIMAIIVGMERNFIPRADGVKHLAKMVTFLEKADRFHGVWSHWIDGNTGKVIPFSTKDNGGDLVETSFLVQGLLTFRQYLQPADTVGNNLIRRINKLWETVEWDWYRKNNLEVLYWHWSPNYNWDMNFALSGYFEEQITYFLAAASPTHGIPKSVYTNGFAKNGAIVKNNTYYGYKLPLESPSPLFWVQYSYLGLDPHFSDGYANYWEQNVNATLINQAYCIANPKKFIGYSADCWGLTASDNQDGYNAHSPTNDLGVITPTAALSSFPYTPVESMKALKFFYYTLGDKLWGQYGFYDAFNLTKGWTATSTLAIDQGPIVVMIENHRTGLLWNLFMSAPEVQAAKTKLNFTP